MLQTKLPIFSEGITNITSDLAFKKENGRVTYFNFSMPVFVLGEKEYETFRMITSQFYVNGTATQVEIELNLLSDNYNCNPYCLTEKLNYK